MIRLLPVTTRGHCSVFEKDARSLIEPSLYSQNATTDACNRPGRMIRFLPAIVHERNSRLRVRAFEHHAFLREKISSFGAPKPVGMRMLPLLSEAPCP